MKQLPAAIAATALMLWSATACRQERQSYVANAGAGDVTPTMATRDVETFISDSGYTRYHVTAPLWLMFEDAEEPFWRFPEGLELEQYDMQLQPESDVVCDSAIYFSRKRLWQLDGNVVMVNTQRDSFLGPEFTENLQRLFHTHCQNRPNNRRLRIRIGAEHELLHSPSADSHTACRRTPSRLRPSRFHRR